jgi:hypothetical protein
MTSRLTPNVAVAGAVAVVLSIVGPSLHAQSTLSPPIADERSRASFGRWRVRCGLRRCSMRSEWDSRRRPGPRRRGSAQTEAYRIEASLNGPNSNCRLYARAAGRRRFSLTNHLGHPGGMVIARAGAAGHCVDGQALSMTFGFLATLLLEMSWLCSLPDEP